MPERSIGALCVALAVTVFACDNATGPGASTVTIVAPSGVMDLGDTMQVVAAALDDKGAELQGVSIEWSTSDTTVVQVDSVGNVRGVGEGQAWLVARAAGRADSAQITVALRRIGAQAFVAVDVGASHACMLTAANEAYCVGMNGSGELGDGSQTTRDDPVLVDAGEGVTRISAGDRHSCALGVSATMYCWGSNSFAQLGDSETSDIVSAPQVAAASLHFVRVVASDHLYTCGLLADGSAYCWGHNDQSQLGRAPAIRIDSAVARVSGGLTFTEIDGGSFHSCALGTDGTALCWGYAGAGALGNGTASETRVASPTLVSGGLHFTAIATGVSHTCAVTVAHEAYCWGSNDGKLGVAAADGTPRPTPMKVETTQHFVSITAGLDHSCALTANGEAYCWGTNARGQLGNFWMTRSNVPVRLAPSLTFQSLSAGRYRTCGVTDAGALYCWPDFRAPVGPALHHP